MEYVASSDRDSIGKTVFRPPHEQALQGLRQLIEAEMAAAGTKSVYLIGHSYGGWSVMKLALMMLGHYNVEGLVTIDPISPLSCTPSRILSLFSDPGCQRAPADISAADRDRLRTETGSWAHFYETQFERLHSSAYSEPRFVKRLSFSAQSPFYNDPHALIGRDPRIWNSIADQIIEFGKR
jgi:pimeloyl-ACP methyl ester carboxylesterase